MGTRSNIIVRLADGTYRNSYCHWDGYLSHNGAILLQHYNNAAKVEKLSKLGDLSVLAPKCSKPNGHTFDNPVEGHCVAYGRDRKEKDTSGQTGATLADVWPDQDCWTEFAYVWDGSRWLWASLPGSIESLRPLRAEDCKEAE